MPIEKRGDTYRARVRLRGRPEQSATFPTLALARAWEASVKGEAAAMRAGQLPRRTVRQMLEAYAERECPKHDGQRWELARIGKFKRTLPFIDRQLATLAADDLARWRDHLTATLKPWSALREYGLLRTITRTAMREWGWLKTSPFDAVKPPPAGKPRKQRVLDDAEAAIVARLEEAGGTRAIVAQAVKFALLTGLRRGEVCRALREHLRAPERVLWVPKSKNGDEREVPLSKAAMALLDTLPEQGQLFPVTPDQITGLFHEAAAALGLPVTFHDTRREALTRMAKKVKDPMLLSKISGHRDLKVLLNTYYRPNMSDAASLLDD